MIDAHQHFWRISRGDYGWLTPDLAPLHRDFEPTHLAAHLEAFGIERSIVVQAAPTVAETRFLLELARATSWIAGVVGWVDLASVTVADTLAELTRNDRLLCGVRPMIQDIADDRWMLGPELAEGYHTLVELDLAFDALVRPVHLPHLLRLMDRHPELRVVIDHGAKPEIADGRFDAWAEAIARVARESSACCKLSGLVTEAAEDWSDEALRPYVDHLLACFGPERLLWGSDWPVSLLAGGYAPWRESTLRLLSKLDPDDRAAVLGVNAARFYRVPPGSQRSPEAWRGSS